MDLVLCEVHVILSDFSQTWGFLQILVKIRHYKPVRNPSIGS
jgi:hypothetical protein